MDKLRVVAASGIVSTTLAALGDLSIGMTGIVNYTPLLPGAENKAFVDAFRAKSGKEPGLPAVQGYIGTQAYLTAVERAHSIKPVDVAKAMSGMALHTPQFGEGTIRAEDHQLTLPDFFGHVERVDGKLEAVVDKTFAADEWMPPPSKECHLQ